MLEDTTLLKETPVSAAIAALSVPVALFTKEHLLSSSQVTFVFNEQTHADCADAMNASIIVLF